MIYFTSDQHYYHKNVIKYCNRPFRTPNLLERFQEWRTGQISERSVRVMNEELIRRHNDTVQPLDVVFHLGDFSLWKHGPRDILHRLNGRHHLVAGNHDWCHPVCGKKKVEAYKAAYTAAGFRTILLQGTLSVQTAFGPVDLVLHHMPYSNPGKEHVDDRYADLRPKDEGKILLHGHVHEAWKVKGRMINVGVDVWDFRPVPLYKILELIRPS